VAIGIWVFNPIILFYYLATMCGLSRFIGNPTTCSEGVEGNKPTYSQLDHSATSETVSDASSFNDTGVYLITKQFRQIFYHSVPKTMMPLRRRYKRTGQSRQTIAMRLPIEVLYIILKAIAASVEQHELMYLRLVNSKSYFS
jgi:hypothetical protein